MEKESKMICKSLFTDIVSVIAEYYRNSGDSFRDPSKLDGGPVGNGSPLADECIRRVLLLVSDNVGKVDGLSLYEYLVLNWDELFGGGFDRKRVEGWYDRFTGAAVADENLPFSVKVKGTSAVLRAFLYRDNRDKIGLQKFVGEYLQYRNNILVMDRGRETVSVYPMSYVVEVPNDTIEKRHEYCVLSSASFKQLFEKCEL